MTEQVKNDIRSSKDFLKNLYKANTKYARNRVLENASNFELSSLIEVIHCLLTNQIPLHDKFKNKISKSGRLPLLYKLESVSDKNFLVQSSRADKLIFLKKVSIFKPLLYCLFHRRQ